jgi:two-component system, chemotaxis family, sensor kinase CheA
MGWVGHWGPWWARAGAELMSQPAITERLMSTFQGELQDHVRAIERDLLALERNPEPVAKAGLYTVLFRSVHSLKGASRVVGQAAVETACHRLEEIFQSLRDDGRSADSPLFQLLLATVDAIRRTGELIGTEQVGDPVLSAVLPLLAAAMERNGRSGSAAVADAESTLLPSPLGGDRAQHDSLVRVPAAKLDMLLSHSEQLLVARRRVETQAAMLTGLTERLRSERGQWPDIERKIALAFATDGSTPSGSAEGSARTRRARSAMRALASHQADLRRLEQDLQVFGDQLGVHRYALDQAAGSLDGEIRRVRMFPFAGACEGLDRAVRDLATGGDKGVRIVVEGGDIELDRSIVEGLRDPLLHLVRNAADHGIETAEVRRRAGKSPTGCITVAARLRGIQVEVEVLDDGRGVDLNGVREEVRKRGLDQGDSPEALVSHVFRAGFSTSASVNQVSGRGVGLDIVKSRVEAMRGTVQVSTAAGWGTRFKLTLPLTLTTLRGLLVAAGGQTFVLDATSVCKVRRVAPDAIRSVEGRAMLVGEGPPIVLASLARQLGLTETWTPPSGRQTASVVVLGVGDRQAAFAADEFLAEQDLLVRGLGSRITRVSYVTGATTLPSGRIALILQAEDLINGALLGPADPAFAPMAARGAPVARKRVVLADDSVTTRTLMKTILEGAGYEVFAVADGADAWRMVQDKGADLVVSDVEMPRMDGFALTEAIRDSAQLRDLPVILVTALESEADRARGLRAGASAYLLKSDFDQRELLAVVEQVL